MNVLRLVAERTDGAMSMVPFVDGTSLIDLAAVFETARGYQPPGGYAGIIPAHFDFGDLAAYYLASQPRQWPRQGHAWLLGCDCGEVGCWPLSARIVPSANSVTWSNFEQPHRPKWDYTGFGPYVFHLAQYESAVDEGLEAARS